MQCSTVQYSVVQYGAVQYSIVKYSPLASLGDKGMRTSFIGNQIPGPTVCGLYSGLYCGLYCGLYRTTWGKDKTSSNLSALLLGRDGKKL